MCSSDVFLAVLAVFFPPIAGKSTTSGILLPYYPPINLYHYRNANSRAPLVWIKAGICTADSLINIALCLLGYIPGLIHAWYIILKYPDQDYDDVAYEPIPGGSSQRRDLENGRVTYYYVSNPPLQHLSQQQGYGTVDRGQQAHSNSNAAPKPSGQPREGAGSSSGQTAPPTYAEAVRGDNKVQTQD